MHGSYEPKVSDETLGSTKQHPSPRQSPHQPTCRSCSSWRREYCMLLSVRTVMACTGEVDYQPPVSFIQQEYIIKRERVSNVGILCIRCMQRVTSLLVSVMGLEFAH